MQRYDVHRHTSYTIQENVYGEFVKYSDAQATIARLTAELAQARAEGAAAAYERAAQVVDRRRSVIEVGTELSVKIRALATEPETTALAEIVKKAVDAETRACIAIVEAAPDDEVSIYGTTYIHDRLTARIDQRKEPSP